MLQGAQQGEVCKRNHAKILSVQQAQVISEKLESLGFPNGNEISRQRSNISSLLRPRETGAMPSHEAGESESEERLRVQLGSGHPWSA